MFVTKNKEYDDAIADTGVLGAVVALAGDVGKLRKLVLQNPMHGRDVKGNVEDKLLDVAVQAIIGLFLLRENNYSGVDRTEENTNDH